MIDDATPDAETTYFGHVEHESSQAVFFKGIFLTEFGNLTFEEKK